MTAPAASRRPGVLSLLMITTSVGLSVGLSLGLDWILLSVPGPTMDVPALALLFNATAILQSGVGAVIEWQRPGHAIGRLLMLSGPLYAALAAGWTAGSAIRPWVDPSVYGTVNWAATLLSYPGVALLAGWLPMLFPTGTLPGPRWRIPAVAIIILSSISLATLAFRPGPFGATDVENPYGIDGWPSFLAPLADGLLLEVLAVLVLGILALATRYRRGDSVERLQIRWLLGALAITTIGFVGVVIESAVRTDDGLIFSAIVAYLGILAMPIAIGIAVLRYRLYEIDRIISRTIGYALVTGVLVVVFAGTILLLQAVLAPLIGGNTVAVAASTLIVAALFQPLRRRIQSAVDRRFDRARYDGERIVAAFAARLRDQVDLAGLESDLQGVIGQTVAPADLGLWVRRRGADS